MSDPRCAPSDTDAAYATALASLGVSPGRLRRLLVGRSPAAAWQALAEGRHPADPESELRARATPELLRASFASRGSSPVAVRVLGLPGYPAALVADPDPPAVLFALGDLEAWAGRPRVAVVGTRSATASGLALATALGADLAEAGVAVISGLARGIDSAVHDGVVRSRAAPPIAVLGTAVDAAVTASQAALRRQVASVGLLLSELPPGVVGARWWFAVRNRVMAALAQVVVVVECHARGGALHTVAAAQRRGVPVAAVPGSIRSAASAGTNALLVQGALAVRDVHDVLAILGSVTAPGPEVTRPAVEVATRPRRRARPMPPGDEVRTVRRALDYDPVTLDVLVERCGMAVGDVALALETLADAGIAVDEHGWWSLSPR